MKTLSPSLLCLLATLNLSSAQPASPDLNLSPREQQIVAAAKLRRQFNGASVIGVRPNTPVIYALTVSGERPLAFSAKKLPAGLTLDAKTGIITGTLAAKGEFTFTASAKNSAGKAGGKNQNHLRPHPRATPPMGWNSYDSFGDNVVESEVYGQCPLPCGQDARRRLGHRRGGLLLVRSRRA